MVLNPRSLIVGGVVAFLAYALYSSFWQLEYSHIVSTSSGKVRGIILRSRLGKNFLSFKGVPYAEAPVGRLRFSVRQIQIFIYL